MATVVPDANGNVSLVIANGGTTSDVINYDGVAGPVLFFGPATLTGTCTVQVSPDNVTYTALQSPSGTDLAIAAAKAVVVSPLPACFLRIVSGSAEGAARTFQLRVATFARGY